VGISRLNIYGFGSATTQPFTLEAFLGTNILDLLRTGVGGLFRIGSVADPIDLEVYGDADIDGDLTVSDEIAANGPGVHLFQGPVQTDVGQGNHLADDFEFNATETRRLFIPFGGGRQGTTSDGRGATRFGGGIIDQEFPIFPFVGPLYDRGGILFCNCGNFGSYFTGVPLWLTTTAIDPDWDTTGPQVGAGLAYNYAFVNLHLPVGTVIRSIGARVSPVRHPALALDYGIEVVLTKMDSPVWGGSTGYTRLMHQKASVAGIIGAGVPNDQIVQDEMGLVSPAISPLPGPYTVVAGEQYGLMIHFVDYLNTGPGAIGFENVFLTGFLLDIEFDKVTEAII
jgi:hypothetical protein